MTLPPLTQLSMVQQLARAWSRRTAYTGGLVFAEPDVAEPVPANIYACPMPEARFRLDPCASLVLVPTADNDPADPTENALVRITFAARDPATAYLLAGDFNKAFFPAGRPADLVESGQTVRGLLGVPADVLADGGAAFRFIDIVTAARVQPENGTGIGRRSPDGLHRLAMAVTLNAIEHTVTAAPAE
jgi:hypothetical protein